MLGKNLDPDRITGVLSPDQGHRDDSATEQDLDDLQLLACSTYNELAFTFVDHGFHLSRKLLLEDIPKRVFFTLLEAGFIAVPESIPLKGSVELTLRWETRRVPRALWKQFVSILSLSTRAWLIEAQSDLNARRQSKRLGRLAAAKAACTASKGKMKPDEIISDWLIEHGQTYVSLAERCGLTASTVWKIAHGSGGRVSSLQAIAKAIGLESWGLLISEGRNAWK